MAKPTRNEPQKRGIRLVTLILIFIIGFAFYCYAIAYFSEQHYDYNYSQIIEKLEIDKSVIEPDEYDISTRVLKVRTLEKNVNEDIVGWLEIEGTDITFPVVQSEDNKYYLKHTYLKEDSNDGAIFLDKDYNWNIPSSNLLIYGHNNLNGNMFQDLLKYEDENYYKEHPTIRFTTTNDDYNYDIIAVFKSRVFYEDEQDVFRYYYFINAENEDEYNYYVEESKKASLYNIDETAEFGDQLLTLSTCEYSQEDGRFVIVAKKSSQY